MEDIEFIKKPDLEFPVDPLIASRWSPRAYDARPVEPEKLQSVFEAARWAASASNLQPWYFMVGLKGDDVYEKIAGSLVEFNQLWALNAPVLVLAIAKTINAKGQPNLSYAYDLGQAVATLSLQAMSLGVYTHQMGGFDADSASKALEIPDEYKVFVAFTLGYRDKPEKLHPNLLSLESSPRLRRPVGETVFTGYFGHRADFL
jgi:nitroreductase